MLDLLDLGQHSPDPSLSGFFLGVAVSFLLATTLAYSYIKTFRGLSYSRNYVQALILGAIAASTIIQAIGDSLARGLGMLGALAIIRFRTSFKDARDIVFMFAALAAGIASGVGGYGIAVVGTLFFVVVALALFHSTLGPGTRYDGLLRFSLGHDETATTALEGLLRQHCRSFTLLSLRDLQNRSRLEYAYQVKLHNDSSKTLLVQQLRQTLPSVEGLSLLLQETTIEV
ncbi:MAG: DUF4956 domain-containing protein [Deltaproteobacteria bacterium RIFOXYA12_FULL_61_11]|nr:MAG: DUF4956 domain-containing protein [Deltaproteobacteria bacterium RIFOXYA12_FULL_61_11]